VRDPSARRRGSRAGARGHVLAGLLLQMLAAHHLSVTTTQLCTP
jgi:hypothetical protein